MFALNTILLVLSLRIPVLLAAVVQVPLQIQQPDHLSKPRKLHGRFLHITDMHPDPHYSPGNSESKACHRKQKNKKKNISGYYGTPYSECDSPYRLTNYTLDYLGENWASEIDFVIWTGDNARHDNDRHLPRTTSEIYDLNRVVAAKMHKTFSSRGIPVVPSLGNNDVWPHNILTPGPNSITNEYSSIWARFIPFHYLQVFQRGAYYTVEVVPDQLAVISLNTMYFYDSNKVVSGCPYNELDDPGNLQLDWLEVQLKMYHQRNIQASLANRHEDIFAKSFIHIEFFSGHVPPSPGNYFPECYVRYAELALRFQNVILGHLFGHMNTDHFFFLEAVDLEIHPEKTDKTFRVAGNDKALYQTLIKEFAALPKSGKTNMDEYAVVNVAPSVVPNPYIPTFRIFAYNISEGVDLQRKKKKKGDQNKPPKRTHGHNRGNGGNKTTHCQTKQYEQTWRCHLNDPWNSDPVSPSRSNQYWTPLGYAQYYLPHLKEASKKQRPQFELEYLTFHPDKLHPEGQEDAGSFQYPVPLQLLPEELKNSSLPRSNKYLPYRMEDLTIPSWVNLARRLADDKHVKLRKKFRKYLFSGLKDI